MQMPNKLPIESHISGETLKRAFNKLVDVIKENIVSGDNKTIQVNKTSSGSTISLKRTGNGGGFLSGGGGTSIYWAKITAVTDANNYTVSIYDRSDESTAIEANKQCRVFDIVDSLAVNDWIPVQASSISGEDYECIQQIGAIG